MRSIACQQCRSRDYALGPDDPSGKRDGPHAEAPPTLYRHPIEVIEARRIAAQIVVVAREHAGSKEAIVGYRRIGTQVRVCL